MYTESDVEQKIIYKLLTTSYPHGLGYSDSDILTKPDIRKITIEKGKKKKLYFPDYIIIVDGLPCLIIEAKAPGDNLEEAAREARLYATEINASYKKNINPCFRIIVSDGHIIESSYWDENEVNISFSTKDITLANAQFESFLKFASKKSISEFSRNCLKLIRKKTHYLKPVSMLGGKTVINETIGQNSFGSNLSLEYKYLFNPDKLSDRELISRNAYVTSKRKESHISPIDKLIKAAIPKSEIDSTLISDTSKANEIVDKLVDCGKLKNEICLIIGSVGSGKSIFTDYLRTVALPDGLIKKTEWINVNLNMAPLTKDLIYDWIVSQVIKGIREKNKKIDFDHINTLKKIYSTELSALEKGRASLFKKNSEAYSKVIYNELESLQKNAKKTLKSIINFLYCNNNFLFVIVLDNCDKRNREDQLLMFDVATWMKEEFPCMIFLPLRDSTYDQYCNEPPLDTVIKDLVFRIDPPLLEKVVYKRLNFAFREIKNVKEKFFYYLPNNAKVECKREDVGSYLKCIVSSLFQDNLFKRIITGLAGRNIRKGLEMFLNFCKSGYITEDVIFKIRNLNGDYKIPPHLVSRILLKGNRKYYSENDSYVKNIFFSDVEDPFPDPFVRVAILNWLKSKYREHGPNKVKGYHKVEDLLSSLQKCGHSKERLFMEIEFLAKANCINTETQSHIISENDLVAIAPSGFIHLDMLKNINYLSTIAEDTLFRENQIANQIADNMTGRGKHKINSRQADISNSRTLVSYLNDYFKNYFLGSVKALAEEKIEKFVDINMLEEFVKRKAGDDEKYNKKTVFEHMYPPGTEVLAQIVSIQKYGIFVEFETEGSGLIHGSNCIDGSHDILNSCEEGDWVIAEVLSYKTMHDRFDLKLLDM